MSHQERFRGCLSRLRRVWRGPRQSREKGFAPLLDGRESWRIHIFVRYFHVIRASMISSLVPEGSARNLCSLITQVLSLHWPPGITMRCCLWHPFNCIPCRLTSSTPHIWAGFNKTQKSKYGYLPVRMIKLTRRLQATHNHIWIFEAVDVNTEDNPPPYESKCYPEIITGGYRLKNIGTGQYIYVTNHPRRLYPFSYGDRVSFVV